MEHNQHGIREILKKNKLIPVVTIDNSFVLENTIEILFDDIISVEKCIHLEIIHYLSNPLQEVGRGSFNILD